MLYIGECPKSSLGFGLDDAGNVVGEDGLDGDGLQGSARGRLSLPAKYGVFNALFGKACSFGFCDEICEARVRVWVWTKYFWERLVGEESIEKFGIATSE